jgi:hypothetical protein
MNIKQNERAKALVKVIQKKGSATQAELAELRELVKVGDGSDRLAKEIDVLEELLRNCGRPFSPMEEEHQNIRECAKRMMFRLKEEGGGMPSRTMRIGITGKNELPSVQLTKMTKVLRAVRKQSPSED